MTSEILFADDDDAMRQMVAAALGAAGFRVRLALDGTEAIHEVRRAPPDLVLLDYRMGRPNGFEVCRHIKADSRLGHLPVLILTAESEMNNRLAGFDAGADDYLAKPFDPRELIARVQALLRLAGRGLDRNPTSRLPGGQAIGREFERRVAAGRRFAVCYVDLDHLKAFNDRFGFAVADAMIRDTGDLLHTLSGDFGCFAGHVGGDDFTIICEPEDARPLSEMAQRMFRERLADRLPAEVLHTGRYTGIDRNGAIREFPLTRLSAAIICVEPGQPTSIEELGEVVAQAKHRAKRTAAGIEEVHSAN